MYEDFQAGGVAPAQSGDVRRSCRNEESPFEDRELFFSRTDPHGVIRHGNAVFQRVSRYDWDELVGKPHKIIRHPDTPRAVFWLLWDTIRRGEPVGAYVKNRAKDGCYYWVFAIVTPIEDGFLSVRLRPGGAMFEAAQDLYRACDEAERAEALTPEASAGRLLGRLGELGFRDYPAFQAAALSAELHERGRRLARPADAALQGFDRILEAAGALLEPTRTVTEACGLYTHLPLNLRIQAAQLGRAGAAISAISVNYSAISTEFAQAVERFAASAAEVNRAVADGLFLLAAAHVQQEMAEVFGREVGASGVDAAAEIARLDGQQRAYAQKAEAGLAAIDRRVAAFRDDCAQMSRLAASLEVTRIMGEVECAAAAGAADGLGKLLEELGQFQRTLTEALRELSRRNAEIAGFSGRLIGGAPEAEPA
ncbi:PAS domain-containing protein [Phenylobacterium sp.]|uniref:PAS domain-containing protein n=1 Tax=Phenylobacterium sp. TaxID=1871053 RepID=UPI002C211CA0|nr:PAS domain-containing protein [Phenylobacterium sp.]HVI33585.1 PAS domain-containing protein [Phenylobacterium sp.]